MKGEEVSYTNWNGDRGDDNCAFLYTKTGNFFNYFFQRF
jgi:hypothetical protein